MLLVHLAHGISRQLFDSRTDTPGRGKPTLPGRRSPVYGLLMLMRVSVMPYRPKMESPKRVRNSSHKCAGSGADPLTKSRIDLPISAAELEQIRFKRAYIAGTPKNSVG